MKAVLQIKCLEERKILEYTLQMKHLFFRFLIWSWDTCLEVILAMNLQWCWEKSDIINQILLTTLSEYNI